MRFIMSDVSRFLSGPDHRFAAAVSGVLVTLLTTAASAAGPGQPAELFEKQIRPVLDRHCIRCHGPARAESDLRLDRLNPNLIQGPDAETWHDVLNRLNLGEMPPADEPPLPAADHERVVDWITGQITRVIRHQRSTGRRVVMRRLTRYEYRNTMRDLLGLDMDFGSDIPPDPPATKHFVNMGAAQRISPFQIEQYLDAARNALDHVIVTGPEPDVIRADSVSKGRVFVEPGSSFLLKCLEYPREGEFVVRVRASAFIPENSGYPRLQVTVGFKSGAKIEPGKIVGETLDLRSRDKSQTFEFRGRIEEFPLPNAGKFPGLLIRVWNILDDGQASSRKKRPKKSGKIKPSQPHPTRPSIVLESVVFEGPVFDQWPPSHHTRILVPRKRGELESPYIRRVLKHFMRRAFRQPPSPQQVAALLDFFQSIRGDTSSLEAAIKETLAMVLIAPDFLFLVEPAQETGRRNLTDFELAARLSYFLWSTMPDDTLDRLAETGQLRNPGVLDSQVRRMLSDPRSWSFVENFTSQWLNLNGLQRIAINPEYFPDFDESLKQDMQQETLHFFAEVLQHDLSALNLIDSDFAMLNQRLAKHYGISGPSGGRFERIALLPGQHRGGLLTQSSVLLVNSNGGESHPVKRGVWLLSRLLGDPPPPPPPDIPELNPEEPDLAGLTFRKQLEIHRTKAACASCHRRIDPWGIPFEEYDAVGNWRDRVRLPGRKAKFLPVDATADLPGHGPVTGLADLKAHLIQHEHRRFSSTIVRKLLAYGLGRSLELGDQSTVDRLHRDFSENDYQIRPLIESIVNSELFQTR